MFGQRAKRKPIVILLLVIVLIIGIAIAIDYAYIMTEHGTQLYPGGPASYFDTGEYMINPKTMLAALDHNETDVFTPMIATPEVSLPSGSLPWHQSDYLKIATAVHHLVWKENLEGWKLYDLHFDRECQNNPSGFDSGEVTYFKTVEVDAKQEYTARGVGIYPLFSQVNWGGGTTYPHYWLLGWKAYDLGRLKITADDALAMAEQNGAKESRLKVTNACRISTNLLSDGLWHVEYYDNEAETIFSMTIDPYSGHYSIPKVAK